MTEAPPTGQAPPPGPLLGPREYLAAALVAGSVAALLAGGAVAFASRALWPALLTTGFAVVAVGITVAALLYAIAKALTITARSFRVSPSDAVAALPADLQDLFLVHGGLRPRASLGAWATAVIVGFVVAGAGYVLVRLLLLATAGWSTLASTWWGDERAAFAMVHAFAVESTQLADRAVLLVAILMAGTSLVGLLRVPHQHRTPRDRGLAASVYVVLMVGWFSLLYFAGSATEVMQFRVSEGLAEAVPRLSGLDATVLAISGLVGGGLGITPANGWARFALGAELLGVAILVFWLFQRGATDGDELRPPPSSAVPASEDSGRAREAQPQVERASEGGLAFVWSEGVRLIATQLESADELDDKVGRLITLVSAASAVAFGVAIAQDGAAADLRIHAQILLIELSVVLAYLLLAFQTRGFAYAPALPALIPWSSVSAHDIRDAFIANLEEAYLANLDAQSIKSLYLRAATAALAMVALTLVGMALWSLR